MEPLVDGAMLPLPCDYVADTALLEVDGRPPLSSARAWSDCLV